MSRNQYARGVRVEINAVKFYQFVDLIRSVDTTSKKALDVFISELNTVCDGIDEQADTLAKANNALLAEARRASKRKNPFDGEQEDPFADLRHTVDGENFIRVIFDVISGIQVGFRQLLDTAQGLRPGDLVVTKKTRNLAELDNNESLRNVLDELSLNEHTIQRFVNGVLAADEAKNLTINLGKLLTDKLDRYYQLLLHRHSIEGIEVHLDPVTTDVAMSIFENVDAHGEIQDGKKPDEISAYSVRKATIIADAIKTGLVGQFIKQPEKLIEFIVDHLKTLWEISSQLSKHAKPLSTRVRDIVGPELRRAKLMSDSEFHQALEYLKDLDPRNVTYKEKTGLITAEERFTLKFQNETLHNVATRLASKINTTDDLIQYILQRKAELRTYYQDENSFYVCKIGAGNPFLGAAPGELEVVPGTRPVVNLDEILGSGFDEIKRFIGQVETSSKWYDLFVATSPSRSGDKSNVLLIGPQGCGKSEILRAVGGDKKSIGVFATGSDFMTCWKGEAEKNPKRLFEAANRLQKESKKHVHILIDEIDTILNKDSGAHAFGSTNLVTEFQNLMDGVVHYPHLSVWGATNNPERLPMPCLRRFAKVLIVGELDQADRVQLLKHFTSFMPVDAITDAQWQSLSKKLDGATGDVIRKITDEVWRDKMDTFVRNQPKEAEALVGWLNERDRFDIHAFDSKKRFQLHERLRTHWMVRAKDLDDATTLALESVSIHHEIRTAQETYSKAKTFLSSIKKNGMQRREEQPQA